MTDTQKTTTVDAIYTHIVYDIEEALATPPTLTHDELLTRLNYRIHHIIIQIRLNLERPL